MLEPLRQLRRVQECKIQLPALVQDHLGLADEVRKCVRAAKDEEPSVEAELLQDWERCFSLCKELREWEEEEVRLAQSGG